MAEEQRSELFIGQENGDAAVLSDSIVSDRVICHVFPDSLVAAETEEAALETIISLQR